MKFRLGVYVTAPVKVLTVTIPFEGLLITETVEGLSVASMSLSLLRTVIVIWVSSFVVTVSFIAIGGQFDWVIVREAWLVHKLLSVTVTEY